MTDERGREIDLADADTIGSGAAPMDDEGEYTSAQRYTRSRFAARARFVDSTADTFSVKLSDEQIANVLTYIRNSFGNRAPVVVPATVAARRAADAKRSSYWTLAELTSQIPAQNAIRAVVTRQVYLGAARDYMVEVADGTSLRATAPTETNVQKGSEVWLTLPPERCRALSR